MISCPQCAGSMEDGATICTHCGAGIPAAPFVPAPGDPALQSPPMFSTPNDLEGIGGWLILLTIGLVVSPFYILGSLVVTDVNALTNVRVQEFMETHTGFQALLEFWLITNIAFILCLVILNILFFTKRRSFPRLFALYLGAQIAIMIGDAALTHVVVPTIDLPSSFSLAIMRSFVGACIWIPYMFVSRRVKATFVR